MGQPSRLAKVVAADAVLSDTVRRAARLNAVALDATGGSAWSNETSPRKKGADETPGNRPSRRHQRVLCPSPSAQASVDVKRCLRASSSLRGPCSWWFCFGGHFRTGRSSGWPPSFSGPSASWRTAFRCDARDAESPLSGIPTTRAASGTPRPLLPIRLSARNADTIRYEALPV